MCQLHLVHVGALDLAANEIFDFTLRKRFCRRQAEDLRIAGATQTARSVGLPQDSPEVGDAHSQ